MSEKTYGDLGRNYFLKYRTIFSVPRLIGLLKGEKIIFSDLILKKFCETSSACRSV